MCAFFNFLFSVNGNRSIMKLIFLSNIGQLLKQLIRTKWMTTTLRTAINRLKSFKLKMKKNAAAGVFSDIPEVYYTFLHFTSCNSDFYF